LSNIAVVISALLIIRQLRETRYTTHAQAYSTVIEILQDEKVRQARKIVFSLKDKPLVKWTPEEINAAQVVCYTYDVVGQMARHHLVPKKIVVDSWGASLRNTWPILSQLIHKYRNEFEASEYWDDYEWLVIEAIKFNNRRQRSKRVKTGYYLSHMFVVIKSRFNNSTLERKMWKRKLSNKSKEEN
jgi:hypothetical protein